MKATDELLSISATTVSDGGVVVVAGGVDSTRTTVWRELAARIEAAGHTVTTTTATPDTRYDHLAALCEMPTSTVALGDLHTTNPVPPLLANDSGTGLLTSFLAVDQSIVISRLVERCQREGLSFRAAHRLVCSHLDLVIICDETSINRAYTVGADGTMTHVYSSTPTGPQLLWTPAGGTA